MPDTIIKVIEAPATIVKVLAGPRGEPGPTAEGGTFQLQRTVTNNAGVVFLTTDGLTQSATNTFPFANNTSAWLHIRVVARNITSGVTRCFNVEGLLKRGTSPASTTWVQDGVTTSFGDAAAAGWTLAPSANTTLGTLSLGFSTGTVVTNSVTVRAAIAEIRVPA